VKKDSAFTPPSKAKADNAIPAKRDIDIGEGIRKNDEENKGGLREKKRRKGIEEEKTKQQEE